MGATGKQYGVVELLNRLLNADRLSVDSDTGKTFASATANAGSNKITVTIAAVTGKKHYIGHIVLTGTTGTGAAEAFVIKDDTTTKWSEAFTVGTDKVRSFGDIPFVGTAGKAVTVEVSATNLTAGSLFVLYYTK